MFNMEIIFHVIFLSTLCITVIEYALNRSLINSMWQELTENIWQDVAKASEFVFMGCIVLLTAIAIVTVINLLLTPSASKKVSHTVLRSCGLTPTSKETFKPSEPHFETKYKEVSPLKSHKGNIPSREPRRYIILLKDEN